MAESNLVQNRASINSGATESFGFYPIPPVTVEKYHGDESEFRGCHQCRDASGRLCNIDLMVGGDFCTVHDDGSITDDLEPEDLVGKVVSFRYTHPYIAIAADVRIVEEVSP